MILLTKVTTPSEEKKASFYLEPVSSIHLINKSFFFCLSIYLFNLSEIPLCYQNPFKIDVIVKN